MLTTLLSSSAALANGVETIVSSFPLLLAKGEAFSSRADSNVYFLDAMLPNNPDFPIKCTSIEESFDVTYRVNETRAQKERTVFVTETRERKTTVVNDTYVF